MTLDPLIERLPHGPAFRFVDELTALEPGSSVSGRVTFPTGHRMFDGHLPDEPLVPGVILIEAMAQLAGLALLPPDGAGGAVRGVLAEVGPIRFRRAVRPDEAVEMTAELAQRFGSAARFNVRCEVGGEPVASGRLTLGRDDDRGPAPTLGD